MARQNGISLEDMLKLEALNGSVLVAGFKGIKNTISRVNIVADPDIFDWVQPGELLLTTAYFFEKDDVKAQKELIKNAHEKKLAGIGIKVSPYLGSLAGEMLDLADELGFPLLDIHYSIPLSDVLMAVTTEIFNKQASLLNRLEKIHERFLNVMIDGKGIGEVVQAIHNNIKNPIVMNLNVPTKQFCQFGNIDEATKEELLRDMRRYFSVNEGRRLERLDEDKVLIKGKYVDRMVMPIVLKGNVYGHMVAWSTTTPLGGFDLSVLESACTTVALAVLQELSVKEVETKYRSDFFEDAISKDNKRKKRALERAYYFNLKTEDYYIIEVMSFKLELGSGKEDEYLFEYLRDYANIIVMLIEEIMDYLNLQGIVSTKLNGTQILLSFEERNGIEEKVAEFNKMLYGALKEKYENIFFRIGVGRPYRGLEMVGKSFSDALKSVRLGQVLDGKEIVTYDDLGIYKILYHDFLTDELEDFYNSTLKPLADYDENKSTELVKTLEAYYRLNGNLTKMSEDLYTHYNTILYRINRIKEITGMELCDQNDRLSLEIALKIKKLLGTLQS